MRSHRAPSLLSGLALSGLALGGCPSKDASPAWALEHASVEVSADGSAIDGYQVWEFYSAAWAESQSDDDHLCSRVQTVTGASEGDLPSGCPGCVVSYALTLAELENDCAGEEATDETYAGTTRYAIGAVSTRLTDDDPHPGDSQGWYGGWGGTQVETLGFVWNEAIDRGEEPTQEGWAGGETYTLSPGYVWDLAGG